MFDFLKKMAGMDSPPTDWGELVREGAQIVDVRTPEEYRGGHIRGSVNVPLGDLNRSLPRIRRDRPVITCCASGMRSASAKAMLERNGYGRVHNGGGWVGLQRRLAP